MHFRGLAVCCSRLVWTLAIATASIVLAPGPASAIASDGPVVNSSPTSGSAEQAKSTTTIDFSTVSQGPFDESFFKADRVVFTEGTFVGFVQGDNALIGPVAGDVRAGFTSLSAQVAPANQGTASYTLAAFKSGKQIDTTTMTVTQDIGDPTTGPPGYFTISIGPLSKKADSFSLSNVFVRSSFPDVTGIEFGVSSITLSH